MTDPVPVSAETPNYNFNLPTVGGNLNNWGVLLNENFSDLDGFLKVLADAINRQALSLVPANVIVAWSGAPNAVPSGWALCDGTNGTPDLREKFILGTGVPADVGKTGGAETVTLTADQIPAHTHPITVSSGPAGGHSHPVEPSFKNRVFWSSGSAGRVTGLGALGEVPAPSDAVAKAVPDHTHVVTATAAEVGGGDEHDNMPPYHMLAYIMKLALPPAP